jgi:hypothetical protein
MSGLTEGTRNYWRQRLDSTVNKMRESVRSVYIKLDDDAVDAKVSQMLAELGVSDKYKEILKLRVEYKEIEEARKEIDTHIDHLTDSLNLAVCGASRAYPNWESTIETRAKKAIREDLPNEAKGDLDAIDATYRAALDMVYSSNNIIALTKGLEKIFVERLGVHFLPEEIRE